MRCLIFLYKLHLKSWVLITPIIPPFTQKTKEKISSHFTPWIFYFIWCLKGEMMCLWEFVSNVKHLNLLNFHENFKWCPGCFSSRMGGVTDNVPGNQSTRGEESSSFWKYFFINIFGSFFTAAVHCLQPWPAMRAARLPRWIHFYQYQPSFFPSFQPSFITPRGFNLSVSWVPVKSLNIIISILKFRAEDMDSGQ